MASDHEPKPETADPLDGEPRVVLGIDRGYPPVHPSDMAPAERQLVDTIIGAGLDMRCAEGFRRPCIIPPAVALAIVRALPIPPPAIERSKRPVGAVMVLLEDNGTAFQTPDGNVWRNNGRVWHIVAGAVVKAVIKGDNEGGQGG